MTNFAIPSQSRSAARDYTPELARRLAGILLGLAGVMARRFLKDPRLVLLIVPLWRRLTRIAGRFERAVARPDRVRTARPGLGAVRPAVAASLPRGRGWLVRELGSEAAGYGSQLAHVLAGPEMQALIAAVPGVGRVLRPVCRMLGYELAAVTQMVAPEVLVVGIGPQPPRAAAVQPAPVPDDSVDLVEVSRNCCDFKIGG